jgi:hypothetical protein
MDAVFALKFASTKERRWGWVDQIPYHEGWSQTPNPQKLLLQSYYHFFLYQAALASDISSKRSYPTNFQLKKKIFIRIA